MALGRSGIRRGLQTIARAGGIDNGAFLRRTTAPGHLSALDFSQPDRRGGVANLLNTSPGPRRGSGRNLGVYAISGAFSVDRPGTRRRRDRSFLTADGPAR